MHVRLHDMERSLDPATAGTADGGNEGALPAIAAHRLRMEISYLRREIAFGLPLLRDGRDEPDLDLSSFDLVEAVRNAAGEFIDSGDLAPAIDLDETPVPIPIESDRAMVTDLIAYLIKTASDELRGPGVIRISVGFEDKDAFVVLSQGRSITLPESSAWLRQSRQFSHAGEPSTGAMGQRLQFAANAAMRLGGAFDVDGPEKARKLMVALPTRLPQRAPNVGPSP